MFRRSLAAAAVLACSLPLLATEPNPSTRQRELVTRILELTNSNQNSLAMMDAVFGQIENQMTETAEANGQDVSEAKEMFAAFRAKAAKLDLDTLMQETYVGIFAKYYTEEDLEALLAFYMSPVGKKTIEVMPNLMREGMEAGFRELTPKIEKIMAEVTAEMEKKRPWRRTMSDMREVSTALEAYAIDHDELYPAGDYAALKEVLTPDYLDELPERDIWDAAYAYVVSPDRRQYRIVSAGADSIFDWDSRRIAPVAQDEDGEVETRYRERLEDDVILTELGFVQLPVQAKPATEE